MEYRIFEFGDKSVVYCVENGQATVTLVPSDMTGSISERKMLGYLDGVGERVEPSMQIGIEGDMARDNLSAGKTYKNTELAFRFGVPDFEYAKSEKGKFLTAVYSADGLVARQHFDMAQGCPCIVAYCEVENVGGDVVLESVPSFTLSRLSPFIANNYDGEIYVYRMLNNWSSEARLVKTDIKDLGFEESWFGIGAKVFRFGQAGSMPANGCLPWVAVEDKGNDCVWAAEIEAPAAWQMELCHVYNGLSVSGGQGDFLSCHWKKTLRSGETFTTRRAYLTVRRGGLLRACDDLVSFKQSRLPMAETERDTPPVYNEYCFSWGKPTEENVVRQLEVCKRLGFGYFVIDAGWYCRDGYAWRSVGDWELNRKLFPSGLKSLAEKCGEYGMKLGLWFEFESVSVDSDVYREHPDFVLSYCGKPIMNNGRCMFDMRKKKVTDYLGRKVIDFVKENGIKYLKVDYNESIGIGVDGDESLGEGLRRQTEASIAFYRRIRREIPDVVVEICSSGGMRHEATWQSLGDLCSFSDAHEGYEGAVIAASLHRFVPPRQMLVWAVVRKDSDEDDVVFTLAKSMLGRPCVSGDPDEREPEIRKFLDFYASAKDVVVSGETTYIFTDIKSFVNMRGVQILKRVSRDGERMLVYCFAIKAPGREEKVRVGDCEIKSVYGNMTVKKIGDDLVFVGGSDVLASIVLLGKR